MVVGVGVGVCALVYWVLFRWPLSCSSLSFAMFLVILRALSVSFADPVLICVQSLFQFYWCLYRPGTDSWSFWSHRRLFQWPSQQSLQEGLLEFVFIIVDCLYAGLLHPLSQRRHYVSLMTLRSGCPFLGFWTQLWLGDDTPRELGAGWLSGWLLLRWWVL